MENTEISWADHTNNLWWGCKEVHAGCDQCYARTLDNRYNHENPHWGPTSGRKIVLSTWKDLARFQRDAAAAGVIKTVFIGSMMDIFEKPMPVVDNNNNPIPGLTTGDLRDRLFLDVIPKSPNLLFLLLTKRNGNIVKYVPETWLKKCPANVMYGTTVVDQQTADQIRPSFFSIPGKKFLSMEPLLGYVNIPNLGKIDWVIVGGESGSKEARPMNPFWVYDIQDQCDKFNVPFHFKQWGHHLPVFENKDYFIAADGSGREFKKDNKETNISYPDSFKFYPLGKKDSGSLLASKEYKWVPNGK